MRLGAERSLRCERIFSITPGSAMLAITRTAPPHALQVSRSIRRTRRRRCAQVIARRRSASVLGTLSGGGSVRLPRRAGVTCSRSALFGANTVIPGEIHPRLGDHGRQPGDELERLEQHMGGTVPVGALQLVAHLPLASE